MNFPRIYRTIKHIKFKQIYYQIVNRLTKVKEYKGVIPKSTNIEFVDFLYAQNSFQPPRTFTFINLVKEFDDVNWNHKAYGKLWTYNLNYFDFLNQTDISKLEGEALIADFISKYDSHVDAKEPYPISLRSINWIKFFKRNEISNGDFERILYIDLKRLYDRVENHLLGNHLLENAFALLFGAYYFKNDKFYRRAKRILIKELNEQILSDGAHFELSPMYHCILFEKTLDCYQLTKLNDWKNDELSEFLKQINSKMLGWLQEIVFADNSYALLNDSAHGIAKSPSILFDYANRLDVAPTAVKLGKCGYRKWNISYAQVIMDIGNIGPDYIPGHAHADTFNFVIKYKGKEIITDPGISTYEKNIQRGLERSTRMHNTVCINGLDSSEVWGGFRVGRRAKVELLEDSYDVIMATHNGFRHIKEEHKREFRRNKNTFEVKDRVIGKAEANFHLGCGVVLTKVTSNVYKINDVELRFEGEIQKVVIESYKLPDGYNKFLESTKLTVIFKKELKTKFLFNENSISN